MTGKTPYRLLMIDDDAALNELLVEYFARFGHRLTTATTAADGRYLLRRDNSDLLILDVMLPDAAAWPSGSGGASRCSMHGC